MWKLLDSGDKSVVPRFDSRRSPPPDRTRSTADRDAFPLLTTPCHSSNETIQVLLRHVEHNKDRQEEAQVEEPTNGYLVIRWARLNPGCRQHDGLLSPMMTTHRHRDSSTMLSRLMVHLVYLLGVRGVGDTMMAGVMEVSLNITLRNQTTADQRPVAGMGRKAARGPMVDMTLMARAEKCTGSLQVQAEECEWIWRVE